MIELVFSIAIIGVVVGASFTPQSYAEPIQNGNRRDCRGLRCDLRAWAFGLFTGGYDFRAPTCGVK